MPDRLILVESAREHGADVDFVNTKRRWRGTAVVVLAVDAVRGPQEVTEQHVGQLSGRNVARRAAQRKRLHDRSAAATDWSRQNNVWQGVADDGPRSNAFEPRGAPTEERFHP